MKIVSQSHTVKSKNSENCIAYEYTTQDNDINSATIKVSGRYPEKGYVTNLECKELCYILKGPGIIAKRNEKHVLNVGDVISIDPQEEYYWEGDLQIFTCCTPAWYPEQHRLVSE